MASARTSSRPRLATLVLLSLTACSCTKLARCELDKVRADVLDYEAQMKPLQPQERQLKRRIDEFEGKIFTNQKAGVDLLEAVLVRATSDFVRKLTAVRVRSHLIRPLHQKKVHAYQELALAYAGVPLTDPKMKKGFDELLKFEIDCQHDRVSGDSCHRWALIDDLRRSDSIFE